MGLDSIGERIAQARRELGVLLQQDVPPAELARMLGINQGTLSAWESNRNRPSEESLAKLEEIFAPVGRDRAWLRYGVSVVRGGAGKSSRDGDAGYAADYELEALTPEEEVGRERGRGKRGA